MLRLFLKYKVLGTVLVNLADTQLCYHGEVYMTV